MLPFPVDPKKNTICDVVRCWAENAPDKPALLDPGKEALSYGALRSVTDGIGSVLRAKGFTHESRIGLISSRSANAVSLLLGVMDTAVGVPLPSNFSPSEYVTHFREKEVDAVIIEAGVDTEAHVVAAEQNLPVLEGVSHNSGISGNISLGHPAENRERNPDPTSLDELVLLLSTAGTGSIPKLVPRFHQRIIDAADKGHQLLQMSGEDKVLVFTPLYYGGALGYVFHALFSGANLVFLESFEPKSFFESLAKYEITFFTGGPTVLSEIKANYRNFSHLRPHFRLRCINAQSAHTSERLAREIEEIFGVPLIQSYSSSETGRITANPLPPGVRKLGTVGLPVDCEVRILGSDGGALPARSVGEIVVKSNRVFGGYENDDAANAQAFSDGWFRTGDEGFFDEDGYLTLTGRIKEMINRGGEKVSPAEVDGALMDHPDVIEAVTFPIPHPTLGEEVAAAVVGVVGTDINEGDLSRYLLDRLSGFKVPRCFVFVDEIPKSDAGKVQRYKLAETLGVNLDLNLAQARKSKRRPSPLEYRLQRLWQRALGVPHAGLDDNFFLLGGDSLQAEELLLQIERMFKCRLHTATLYKASTVAEMAALIQDETEGMEIQGAMVPIQPDGDRPPFFCVHARIGGVIFLYPLSQYLGADQPLYGIQPVGWDPATVPFTKANDMAAHYVAEIRKIQPQGPYFIGGYSFGGRVAVYIARQLRAAGEEVAFLGLFDTVCLAGRRYISLGQWLARNGAPKGAKRVKEALSYVRARGYQQVYDRVLRTVLFPVLEFYRASGKPLPLPLCRPDACNRLMRFEHRNMPTYEGDAVYFKAETDSRSIRHPDTRDSWHRIIKGRLNTIHVSGTHLEMMREPHAQSLAAKLAGELKRKRQK